MAQKREQSDPDACAMALYMSIILYESIETAGAVRDLVYHALTDERRFITVTVKMFEKAEDAASRVSDDIDKGFAAALAAVRNMPDPAAAAITETVSKQVENSMSNLPYHGVNHAAAAAFAAAFPDKASALAAGHAKPDHLIDLSRVFQAGMQRGPADWPLKGHAKNAFKRRSKTVASRAVRAAVADCGNVFAVAAAAQAVMVKRIPYRPRKFLKLAAPHICEEISAAISRAGASQKFASEITAEMLNGARMYPYDDAEACGEAAVRAVRAAHFWAAQAAARAALCAQYALAAGAAWTTTPNRGRFESAHSGALGAVAGMDHTICSAFDKFRTRPWNERPFDVADEDRWKFFSGASGLSVSGWAGVAQRADYRAAATAEENSVLIETYTRAHDGALEAAGRAALKMRREQASKTDPA